MQQILTCRFCNNEGDADNGEFSMDKFGAGFWCEVCDGYTYLQKHKSSFFKLVLEDKTVGTTPMYPNMLKLAKRLSPYRYAGGKSKLINYLITHLKEGNIKQLVSPFTGGGSFELALLDAGIIEKLHMNDLDTGVYSFWWTVKHMPDELIGRLEVASPTHKDFFKAQSIIKSNYVGVNIFEAAWASLVVNRLAYSGIYKANPLGGRKGNLNDLLSRWNATDLIKRIKRIHAMADQIEITQLNAVELIEEAYWQPDTALFIDPPYVEKGKDLYPCYYNNEDHIELAVLLDSLYHGMPGADILLTYDYNDWRENLYDHPEKFIVGRKYSA